MELGINARGGSLPAASVKANAALAVRLAWTTALRVAFLLLFLAAVAFFYLRGDLTRYPHSLRVGFVTLGVAFAGAAGGAALLRRGRGLSRIAQGQIVLDQLTWTAIVYVSGGATSGATSIYALTALVGAIVVGLRGAVLAAAVGIGAYGLLCAGFWLEWLHPPSDQTSASYVIDGTGLVYALLVNTLGIVVVALLAGYLAERLRITGGALEEATERANAAERLAELGRLAAGLAHEIRNPLGSISGAVEMLRESTALGTEDKQLCAIIARETTRLNNLVTDMVDLSKPRKPKRETVDVGALARDVVALAARSERSGAGDVPVKYVGPSDPVPARCDGAQMHQVLWNLVRNAVQASPPQHPVEVEVSRGAPYVIVTVRDQGPGIADGDRERIFDAYYTNRTKGTGIGLAVVKRILDDHAVMGASIDVTSAPGQGTTFTVRLRMAQPSDVGRASGIDFGLRSV